MKMLPANLFNSEVQSSIASQLAFVPSGTRLVQDLRTASIYSGFVGAIPLWLPLYMLRSITLIQPNCVATRKFISVKTWSDGSND